MIARLRLFASLVVAVVVFMLAGAAGAQPAGFVPPKLKTDSAATYPTQALQDHVREAVTVVLILEIDTTGVVTKATVTAPQGHGFDEAAVAAAEKLIFEPAQQGGKPVAVKIKFRFPFPVPPPKLSGRVARNTTDRSLSGAHVTVRFADGKEQTVDTGADGTWSISPAVPGKVHITVEYEGYKGTTADEELQPGEETNLVLRLAKNEPPPVPVVIVDAGAPDAADAGPEIPVEEVIVKGEKPPREVTKRTLTKDEIDHIPGTNGDALRSLQNLPGVARPPPFSGMLIVRGSAPEDTQIYVDGTPIPIVYHFGGLSSVIPTEVLQKIDFYPGNFSAQYGRGMGGVVDVGIRDPKKDGFHGMAQIDLIDARLMAEGPIGNTGWNFLAAARRSWFDLWLGPVLTAVNAGVTTAPRYYDYQLELQKDFDKHQSFRLLFFGSDDALSLLRTTSSQSNPTLAGGIGDDTSFWRLQARYVNKFSDKTELKATAAVGQDNVSIGFGTDYFNLTSTPISARVELTNKVAPGVTANSGIDLLDTPYTYAVRFPPLRRPGVPSGGPGATPLDSSNSSSIFLPGVYSEWELLPWKGTRIVPGLRLDYDSVTQGWDLAPRINVRQDIVADYPRTILKGGVGLYYQPPQPQETDPIFGQGGLSSNRVVHYDIGMEQDITRQIDVSMDLWYKSFSNLVTQGAGNVGEGFAYGVEWFLRYKADAHFFGWLAYTISRSERRDIPSDPLTLFQYDQTHILTLIGSYKLGRGWQLGARFRLVSGDLYSPSVDGAFDATVSSSQSSAAFPPNQQRLPPFEQLDIRIDKVWQMRTWKLTAYLDVQNVYNRANPEGVTYNYNFTQSTFVSGLPILPSFGMRAEF